MTASLEPARRRPGLRGQAHPDHRVGHTPLAALSVFALLVILIAQVSTGLGAEDEISASGVSRTLALVVILLCSGLAAWTASLRL